MADQRLILGLTAWLKDSEVPPPDASMSTTRVVAGMETTERLGRFWPPARLAPKVEPAPALGAFGPEGPPPRPLPRVKKPRFKARAREVVTPIRALAVGSVVALVLSVVLLLASLMPRSTGPTPGAPAPAVLAAASPSVLPTAVPTPVPTAVTPVTTPTTAPGDLTHDWQGQGMRMQAASIRISVGERELPEPIDATLTSTAGPDGARLEGSWVHDGTEHRLVIQVKTDGQDWWLGPMRTYDGRRNPRWIVFGDMPRTRIPVGETVVGDLRAESTYAQRKTLREEGSALLHIDGLRLTAFEPQTP